MLQIVHDIISTLSKDSSLPKEVAEYVFTDRLARSNNIRDYLVCDLLSSTH